MIMPDACMQGNYTPWQPYTVGGAPPPPSFPPPLSMLEADSKEDLSLKFFGPPPAGTIGGPKEEGGPSQPPPPPHGAIRMSESRAKLAAWPVTLGWPSRKERSSNPIQSNPPPPKILPPPPSPLFNTSLPPGALSLPHARTHLRSA